MARTRLPGTAQRDGALRLLATVTAWAVGVVLYVTLLMGATAITVLVGSRILQLDRSRPLVRLSTPLVEGLSLLLWAFGTWTIPLLVVFGTWRHVLRRHRLAYTPQLWTVVFPLGMYSVATAEFGRVTGLPFLAVPARVVFWVALVAWVVVFVAMPASLVAGRAGWKMGRRT